MVIQTYRKIENKLAFQVAQLHCKKVLIVLGIFLVCCLKVGIGLEYMHSQQAFKKKHKTIIYVPDAVWLGAFQIFSS